MSDASNGKQTDQSEMNAIVMTKMMKILPFFMFFIMISVPGALALYYATSNIVAVLQQGYILKQDEEEMDKIADIKAPKANKSKKQQPRLVKKRLNLLQ